jgi:hypothetical protein
MRQEGGKEGLFQTPVTTTTKNPRKNNHQKNRIKISKDKIYLIIY